MARRFYWPPVLYSSVLPFVSLFCLRLRIGSGCGEPSSLMWVGNFRQIRGVYGKTQLVLTENGGSGPRHCRDLRRDSFWHSAGAGMADAENSSLKWSFASAICSHDDRSSGDQGTFGLLGFLGSRRGLPFGQLRRISVQHRSAATIFA